MSSLQRAEGRSRSRRRSQVTTQNVPVPPKRSRRSEPTSSNHRRGSSPPPLYSPDSDVEGEANAEFQEGDQIIQMSVQPGDQVSQDETDYDEDSDNEVYLRNSQQSADEEALAPEYHYGDQESDHNETRQRQHSTYADIDGRDKREQIKRLDQEMKQRILELKKLMSDRGMTESAAELQQLEGQSEVAANRNTNAALHSCKANREVPSRSEETIYKNAVPKRASSSSDEGPIDTSDELIDDTSRHITKSPMHFITAQFQASDANERSARRAQSPQPSTSGGAGRQGQMIPTPAEKADRLIREAEGAKAKIFPLPGSDFGDCRVLKSLMMDDQYMMVGAHVDEITHQKIVTGKYVDFSKLIPRERIETDPDNKPFQLFQKGGQTFFAPPKQGTAITSLARWDQAFRVYANIYTARFPQRAAELIEYSHTIHTIAASYVWENVYLYDIDFRTQMSNNPDRAWSVILQYSWNMRLKDKIQYRQDNHYTGATHRQSNNSNYTPNKGTPNKNEPCSTFQQGKMQLWGVLSVRAPMFLLFQAWPLYFAM